MKCVNPIFLKDRNKLAGGIWVPCGKCVFCRKAISKEWGVRIVHELEYYKGNNVFFTLTYDDENLPENGSLCKRDVQLFLKRLRKAIYPEKIKYFYSGEYGDETLRPHYHFLLFGLDQNKKDLIEKCWEKGFIDKKLGYVCLRSANYCMKYLSKQTEEYKKFCKDNGLEIPFRDMSKGIGKRYALENKEIYTEGRVQTMNGRYIGMPKYYGRIIDIPEETKMRLQNESLLRRLEKLRDKLPEYLKKKYDLEIQTVSTRAKFYQLGLDMYKEVREHRKKEEEAKERIFTRKGKI